MMSHMDPAKGNKGNAPCMRSKRDPPKDVHAIQYTNENISIFIRLKCVHTGV